MNRPTLENASSGMPADRILAISWEDHRRMREICDWLGIPLTIMRTPHRGLRRYMALSWTTVARLWRTRPQTVFLQNPSLILALVTISLRRWRGHFKVVMDAHNEAVTPFANAYWPITSLSAMAMRWADITVVTNSALAEIVRLHGGQPLILPDRLPAPPVPARLREVGSEFAVMVVCTYAADEPIAEIIQAAATLGDGYRFSITGNSRKLDSAVREKLPPNVTLTGFLPEHEYWQLMADSHAVLDFTLKPDCLVCGAYEALSLSKPMILSGNAASRDLFGQFAVFPSDHSAIEIAKSIRWLRENYAAVASSTARERPLFAQRWGASAKALREQIFCTQS
jgi:hypothetical protein